MSTTKQTNAYPVSIRTAPPKEKIEELQIIQNAARMTGGNPIEEEQNTEDFIFGIIVGICIGMALGYCLTTYF